MSSKKILVQTIIKSLDENWEDWEFGSHTADNKKSTIRLWIANIPILNLYVYEPTSVSFNIIQKIKVYRAMSRCRSKKLIKLINNCNI